MMTGAELLSNSFRLVRDGMVFGNVIHREHVETYIADAEAELTRTKRALWLARANAAENAAMCWEEIWTNEVLDSRELYDIDYCVLTDKLKRTPFEWQCIFKRVAERLLAYADKFIEEK